MYDPEKHHRRSIRLKEYDYSRAGAYFVTVCIKNKVQLLGEIIHGEMLLSKIGKVAEKCWNEIPIHYPRVQLDKYIVMPNHTHGIIRIIDDDRGREGFHLPSLRTVQAGLPHTALQSVVTPSGLTDENINCGYMNNSYLIMMTSILIIRPL